MKKVTLPKLKKKALDLYSELVKLKESQSGSLNCYTCGKLLKLNTADTQLGHFLSRGAYPGLTFHPNNSRVQCFRCNVWLHGATIEFRERLINEIGLVEVEKLEAQRHNPVKLGKSDYLEMIEKFTNEIKNLK
jgi:hypothetical protein